MSNSDQDRGKVKNDNFYCNLAKKFVRKIESMLVCVWVKKNGPECKS